MNTRIVAATLLLLWSTPLAAAIRGAVVHPGGAPIPNATVKLFAAMPERERNAKLFAGEEIEPLATTVTDARGNFSLDTPGEGNYVAEFHAPGHVPVAVETTGAEDLAGIALRPAKQKHGRVTANGTPVAGATLLFSSPGANATFVARTDDEGKYAVPDPAEWSPGIVAVHPSYARLLVPPRGQGALPLDLKLTPGTRIRGRILTPDGKSGAKAKLAIDGIAHGESNDDGTFELTRVPAGWHELTATAGALVARVGRGTGHESIRLAPAVSFSGSVSDAKTRVPLAGATVLLRSSGMMEAAVAETVTDAKGRFTLGSLLPGQYVLAVTSAGYGRSAAPQTVTAGIPAKSIHLRRDARLTGRVTDDERNPVAGARVTHGRMAFWAPRDAVRVSAPDGRYAVRIPLADVAEVEITAAKRGYASAVVRGQKLASGDEKTLNLELTRGIAVTGHVTGPEGEPLRDVAVTAAEVVDARMHVPPPDMRDAPRTDAEGRFVLPLRAGNYDLFFSGDGFVRNRLRQVKVEGGMEPLRVKLERGVTVSGRVVYAGGEPAPNLTVSSYSDGDSADTRTDEGGAFVLAGVPPKSLTIWISSDDMLVNEDRAVKAPAENVLIELTPSVRVSGRVVAAGTKRAVTDYHLELLPPSAGGAYYGPATTIDVHDSEGKFVLERVFVRPTELRVTAPGFAPATMALALEKGKELADVEVTLAPGSRIVGRVTTQSGAPADGVRVTRNERDRAVYRGGETILTDANGEYAMDGVPYGEATLTFRKSGFQQTRKTIAIDSAETRLDAQIAAGKTLTGRVVNETGGPVPGASVAANGTGVDAPWTRATADDAGRFTLEGLAPDVYRITASKSGFAGAVLTDVDPEKTADVTITLTAGATITGRIIGMPPERYRDISIAATTPDHQNQIAAPDASGNYRMEGAPVGKVRVRAMVRGAGSRSSEFVDIETQAGGTHKADIEFLEHNTMRGKVTKQGVPVRGGSITFLPQLPPRISASGAIGDDGQYEVSGVRSGETSVVVTSFAENFRYMTRATISRSGTLDLDLHPATLTGVVVDDATGQPLAGADLVLEPAGQDVEPWLRGAGSSGTDGRFVLSNVVPGAYRLRVSRDGYAAILSERTVSEGATVDLTLRLTPSAGVVLRAVDARTGQPVRALVTAYGPDGSIAWQGQPEVNAEGVARVPLAPGTYRANVSSYRLGPVYTTMRSPGSHEVALRPAGRVLVESTATTPVRAIVVAADGSPYDADPRTATAEFFLAPGSATSVGEFAPGRYTLRLLDDGGTVTKSVPFTVAEGETLQLSL